MPAVVSRRGLLIGGLSSLAAPSLAQPSGKMTTLPAIAVTERAAPLTAVENYGGFRYYSMYDRSFSVPSNLGVVTHIGCYSARRPGGSWRPKLAYCGKTHHSDLDWLTFYSHPNTVKHGGSGWEWVEVPRIRPNAGGPVHVGAYFAGDWPAELEYMSPGPRVEIYSDATGVAVIPSKGQGNYPTPALAVRIEGVPGPCAFYADFEGGYMDGCGTNAASQSMSDGVLSLSGWDSDDNNHIDGIGVLSLILYKNGLGFTRGDGTFSPANLCMARLTARVRGVGFDPGAAQIYPWIQAKHPGADLWANWAMTGRPLTEPIADGQWANIDLTLEPDPSLWTYAGGSVAQPQYQYLSLAETLKNIVNLHLPAVRAPGTQRPIGTVQFDSLGLVYPNGE